jgi:hypothetical protein
MIEWAPSVPSWGVNLKRLMEVFDQRTTMFRKEFNQVYIAGMGTLSGCD